MGFSEFETWSRVMPAILWTGFRQFEAIRESVVWALSGNALADLSPESVGEWLQTQGVPKVEGSDQDPPHVHVNLPGLMISTAMISSFSSLFGYPLEALARRTDSPDERLTEYAVARSGAGWQNPANFVITSAFVRLLGASEQFEMDVLKSLLYYRPSGKAIDTNSEPIMVEADVLLEQPEVDGEKRIFHKLPIWTWIRKQAENNIERDKIFSNVFGIKTVAAKCSAKKKAEWYEKRNAIAHGRSGVEMALSEYIEVEVFLAKSLLHVAIECAEKLGVLI